jgi:hypothetical protein
MGRGGEGGRRRKESEGRGEKWDIGRRGWWEGRGWDEVVK